MDDARIIELYRQRSEDAVRETELKYGRYLRSIVQNIVRDESECCEVINDVLLNAWNSIPPADPQSLQAFLARIARNKALDRYRSESAGKRGGGSVDLALEELGEITSGLSFEDDLVNSVVLSDSILSFINGLERSDKLIFLKRYWYFMPVKQIAKDMRLGESKVKMTLLRLRAKLKQRLEEEGFEL